MASARGFLNIQSLNELTSRNVGKKVSIPVLSDEKTRVASLFPASDFDNHNTIRYFSRPYAVVPVPVKRSMH